MGAKRGGAGKPVGRFFPELPLGEGVEAVACEVAVEGGALRLTATGVPCGHWRLSLRCDHATYGQGHAPTLVEVQPGALEA